MRGKDYIRDNRRKMAAAMLVLLALGLGALTAREQTGAVGPAPGSVPGGLIGREGYLAEPGAGSKGESAGLLKVEDYWSTRVTYPTGKFSGAWLLDAARQDSRLSAGVPAGSVVYNRDNPSSPLSLDPTRWTSLGPQPM